MDRSPAGQPPPGPAARGNASRRLLGVGVAVAGILLALASLAIGHAYLIAHDRLLVLKPDWAEPAALDRLVTEPGTHDDRRVRVRGELWRVAPDSAVLVPAGSGPERLPVEALTAFIKDPANAGKEPPTVRPLPATRLLLDCAEGGAMKTLSFYEAAEAAGGGEVEVAGRFRRGEDPGGTPVLRAVAVVTPPQPDYRAPVILVLGLGAIGPVIGAGLAFIGWRLAR